MLLTNDPFEKVEGETLFNLVRKDLFENSADTMEWDKLEDVPDDDVWDDINLSFSIGWEEFKRNIEFLLGENYLALIGKVGRWNGDVWFVERIESGLRTLHSYLEDCDYITVREKDDRLFIEGTHHDGNNYAEIRILTEEGMERLREDAVFDPDGEGMTLPLKYTERFSEPTLVMTRRRSWLWDVIEKRDAMNLWDDDDGAVEYYSGILKDICHDALKVIDGAYGISPDTEGLNLLALTGRCEDASSWAEGVKALALVSERFEANVFHMNVDVDKNAFHVILLIKEQD